MAMPVSLHLRGILVGIIVLVLAIVAFPFVRSQMNERVGELGVIERPEVVDEVATFDDGPIPDLILGDNGPAVAALQTALAENGFDPGPIDGAYGGRTAEAVRQAKLNLELDLDAPTCEVVTELRRRADPIAATACDLSEPATIFGGPN